MNTAQRVIAKFGSQTALAGLIGKKQSTVQHWAKTGIIPAKWQSQLIEIAREKGIGLTSSDFLLSSVEVIEKPSKPIARWQGILVFGENDELPCFVLNDGRRVISRSGATTLLTGGKGGGNLESYIKVHALGSYIPQDIADRMIEFEIPQVTNKTVLGLEADDFLEICRAYVKARDNGALTTGRQFEIAVQASMLLAACAKTGLIALIDEVTGYQYERAEDALQVKLRLYLEDEMRKWEKTFPDELWVEFGRLTHWAGLIHQRPKYWGKLVMEIIYGYLDPDVTKWLEENAPKPKKGQNYHQWLSNQYGLQKLIQHIWMAIGIAKTCRSMPELREKMAVQFGREPVQLSLYLPPPSKE